MIRASCPACGAPIEFAHASAVTTICAACRNAVVRTDIDLQAVGRVAPLGRDLSPLQLGVRGHHRGLGFSVVGVVRKGREGVRWNEWFLLYEDATTGWLSDGNGEVQVYDGEPTQGVVPAELRAGATVRIGRQRWSVAEIADAEVLAAEGELPFAVHPGEPLRYVDLKGEGGAAATLDLVGDPLLWIGRTVELPKLNLKGLRRFTGWGAIAGLDGPDIEAVRKLQCPQCGGGIDLRAPGAVQVAACGWCGSTLDARERDGALALRVLAARAKPAFKPRVPLGAFGTLDGVRWQAIGAMVRAVNDDGVDYAWTETLLWNPYVGSAWLIEGTDRHWSLARKVSDPPDPGLTRVQFRGTTFKHFQSGVATVRHVLGEFTWAVAAGQKASASDFVAPPRMLSVELADDEATWTLGTWLPPETVAQAFGIEVEATAGVAPHQPNPWHGAATVGAWRTRLIVVAAAALAAWFAPRLVPTRTLTQALWTAAPQAENVWISDPFDVQPGTRTDVQLTATAGVRQRDATLHVALLDPDHGEALHPAIERRDAADGARLVGRLGAVVPARYVARVELAARPDGEGTVGGASVVLRVRQAVANTGLRWLGPVALLLFAASRTLAGWRFEAVRWSTAGSVFDTPQIASHLAAIAGGAADLAAEMLDD